MWVTAMKYVCSIVGVSVMPRTYQCDSVLQAVSQYATDTNLQCKSVICVDTDLISKNRHFIWSCNGDIELLWYRFLCWQKGEEEKQMTIFADCPYEAAILFVGDGGKGEEVNVCPANDPVTIYTIRIEDAPEEKS
jgi:hypothetical protein